MAEEHNLYPWKGPDDDSSWQPSHIAKGNDASQGENADQDNHTDSHGEVAESPSSQDTQETQNFTDFGVPSIPAISGNLDEQSTTALPTVHSENGTHADDEDQQTHVIPTGDNADTFAFNDLGSGSQRYDGFVAPRSPEQPSQDQPSANASFQAAPSYASEQTQQPSQQPEQAQYGQPEQYGSNASNGVQGGVEETQPVAPQYRPAPQYGAYAPQQETAQQQPQPQSANAQYGSQQGQYNPFTPEYGNMNQNQQGNPAGGQFPGQGPTPQGQNGPQKGGRGKGGSKTLSTVLVAVIAAVLSAALMLGLGWAAISSGLISTPTTSSLSSINSNSSGSGSATAKSGEAADWQAVSKSVSNSVVAIDTVVSGGTAKGSGAIIDTSGDVVTNNHVVEGATQIQVTLSSGQIYSAKVVGTDTTTDLAVIKIENPPSDLQAITFADSDSLAVGESVMAIGNPLGYDNTATTGIVSALNRPVSVMDDTNTTIVTNAVQIDAAINPGNSGGPTFNAAGQVIGINSSIASTATTSSSAGSIGIGFAIPSNLVKRVANEIIKNGSVQHVVLGITIQSATAEADGVTRAGAQVTKVTSGSAAANGGVKAGDTIVAFNGNAVNSNYALLGYVRASALNDKVTLTVVRSGKTLDLSVTLDQKEAAVSGSSKSDSNDSGNSGGSGSDGDSGSGSDDGGLTDPYGLFGN
ncbi:MAG: trypsin-like peptidase domain-containing protein [Bifidobacterium sp.]|jgi:putative serine protease PepD|nr:trypsin-like peptidase domain-containing protein [Bifidobacterium sp.]MCH4174933.1 trypsin-like peptidase domain-containing protein [Bifidobacterium sp.]